MSVDSAPRECLLRLPINAMIQASSVDKSIQYMTHLVGIDGDKVLITSVPSMKQINREGMVFDDVFYPERPLIMRVLSDGIVYAFETHIISVHHSSSRLLISTYPETIQKRNLRKEARYPCALATTMTIRDATLLGAITDINLSGCQLCVAADTDIEPCREALELNETIALQLQFPNRGEPDQLAAKICHLHSDGEMFHLGLAFEGEISSVKMFIDALHLESVGNLFGACAQSPPKDADAQP